MHEEQRVRRKSGRPIPPAPREQQQLDPIFFRGGARTTTTHTRGGTQRTDIAPPARPKHQMTKAMRVTGTRQITGLEVGTAGRGPREQQQPVHEEQRVSRKSGRPIPPAPREQQQLAPIFFRGWGARTTTTRTRGGTQRTDIEPPPLLMDRMTTTRRVTITRQTNVLEVGTATRGTRRG